MAAAHKGGSLPKSERENSPVPSLLMHAREKTHQVQKKLHNISRQLTWARKKNLVLTESRNIAQESVKKTSRTVSALQLQRDKAVSHGQTADAALMDALDHAALAEHDIKSTHAQLSTVKVRNKVWSHSLCYL